MAELNEKTLAEIVKLARATGDTQLIGNAAYTVIPSDCKVEDLSRFIWNEHQERPERMKGVVRVHDAGAFCEYWTLFHDPNSRIFADEINSHVLAVLDYHAAAEGAPRWGQHRLSLTLRHSPEWLTWKKKNGEKQSQMDFGEFIESNAPDIIDPPAAVMLEIARDLSAKTDVDFASAMRTANGSVQFKYTEQVKGTYGNGNVDIPEQFTINIPVYVGGDRMKLTARLRYRINIGKLTFWYDLLRAEAVERDAFLGARNTIADTLKVTIINGVPA